MEAVAAFSMILCYLTVSHAWLCDQGRMNNALQIDAGQGKVVAINRNMSLFFLTGSTWVPLTPLQVKHATVGPAGLWATDTENGVYKYVAGQFQIAKGLKMLRVDAGGSGQLVGIDETYRALCLESSYTSAFSGKVSLSWKWLAAFLRYYSCGPLGCWGVDRSGRILMRKNILPHSCGTGKWTSVPGQLNMIEVGTGGEVFGVAGNGLIYQRVGISKGRPEGKQWRPVQICMKARHVSYDLGTLWVVSSSGLVLMCKH